MHEIMNLALICRYLLIYLIHLLLKYRILLFIYISKLKLAVEYKFFNYFILNYFSDINLPRFLFFREHFRTLLPNGALNSSIFDVIPSST